MSVLEMGAIPCKVNAQESRKAEGFGEISDLTSPLLRHRLTAGVGSRDSRESGLGTRNTPIRVDRLSASRLATHESQGTDDEAKVGHIACGWSDRSLGTSLSRRSTSIKQPADVFKHIINIVHRFQGYLTLNNVAALKFAADTVVISR
jgi:hypothetical protein